METLKAKESYQTVPFNALVPTRPSIAGIVRDLTPFGTRFYGFHLTNGDAALVYVQIFLKPASQVVLGTTVPDATYTLPVSASTHIELNHSIGKPAGLSIAVVTTNGGSTGATVGATGHVYVAREGA